MKVLEIKNNLVKISNDSNDKLILAGFVVIEDEISPYVAQIVSLKADNGQSYAIAKLMFTFDNDGIVKNYDGSIPSLNANVSKLSPAELLDILPIDTPLKLGNLAQQDFLLNVDVSILEGKLLICSDSAKNTAVILNNFSKQLENRAESSVIFDIDGKVETSKKLLFGRDFKLPLNFETINFIYANDLNDIDPTSKAVIQDIFLEVQEYTRTVPDKYIPFDTFIDVVSQQYRESNIPELALLKNKLLKYKEENVFAQSKYEITGLSEYIKDNYSVVLDISNVDSNLQREIISYVYAVLEDMNAYISVFVKVNDENSDKKLLKLLFSENKIYTNIICNHNYKYVYELKEKANNLILFTPETTQHDFASYNTFLNKLNHDEFVVYGKSTQMIPLIVELSPIEIVNTDEVNVTSQELIENNPSSDVSIPEKTPSEEEQGESQEVENTNNASDFTDNEDTYTDLSDDIERKPQEEDYSMLSEEPQMDLQEDYEDDFDVELAKSNDVGVNNIEQDKVLDSYIDETQHVEDIDDASETISEMDEEIIMPNGQVFQEEDIENIENPQADQIELPDPQIDERISEDIDSINSEERILVEDSIAQTPYENDVRPEHAKLIPDDEDLNDELIEKVARDVDKNFIYSKIEQDNLEDEDNADTLTEDDLNFIDDINHGENELLEPVVDAPENFEDDQAVSIAEEEEQTPVVPVYPADTPNASQSFEQGDHVSHPKYGEGVIEKMIRYGNKTLCSINFVNVGRRLLDPAISEISKL